MHIFRTKLGNLSLQVHTWPEALELHWNLAMKDEAESLGDFQLDLMRNGYAVYNASWSNPIFVKKLFVGSGNFYMRTWLAYLLTTVLGTRCQNFR